MIRSAKLPKNPNTTDDIENLFNREDIKNTLGQTKSNSIFFDGVLEGNDHSACFFSSKDALDIFEQNVPYGEREIMIDGTFDIVPIGTFKQLLVVYGVYMGKVRFFLVIAYITYSMSNIFLYIYVFLNWFLH